MAGWRSELEIGLRGTDDQIGRIALVDESAAQQSRVLMGEAGARVSGDSIASAGLFVRRAELGGMSQQVGNLQEVAAPKRIEGVADIVRGGGHIDAGSHEFLDAGQAAADGRYIPPPLQIQVARGQSNHREAGRGDQFDDTVGIFL